MRRYTKSLSATTVKPARVVTGSFNDLDWTYVSPAALFLLSDEPGGRRGAYHRGTTKLLVDENGKSEISGKDYAIRLLDEVEKPQAIRQQITLAW
jgi:putative NADH-flavin reductase